jgi:hypothetical protein
MIIYDEIFEIGSSMALAKETKLSLMNHYENLEANQMMKS